MASVPESNILYAVLLFGFITTLRTELGWNFSTLTAGPIVSMRDTTHGTSHAPAVAVILSVALLLCAIKSSPTLFTFNIRVRTWYVFRGHWKSSFLTRDLETPLRIQGLMSHLWEKQFRRCFNFYDRFC